MLHVWSGVCHSVNSLLTAVTHQDRLTHNTSYTECGPEQGVFDQRLQIQVPGGNQWTHENAAVCQ